uniref:RNA polymerase sigma factor n=3 Tax=uncultured Parabacteroides sp. TaxID=512312 RepID=UPI00266DA4E2
MNALQFQKKLLSMQENMMNFALMLTANRDDAQDLMQDTTLKVLDNQEKFVDNINFKGWVLTVMRNIFINNYHKIVRTQTVVDQGVDLYNLDVVNDSGFDSPDGAYQIKEITKAINSLNDELKSKHPPRYIILIQISRILGYNFACKDYMYKSSKGCRLNQATT